MDLIKAYLKNESLLKDKKEVEKVKNQLSLYYLENDQLYKRSFSMPLLMCLNEEEANYVLPKLHEGICDSHVVGMTLALKALRNDYFWPTMRVNALDLIKRRS